MNEQKLTPWFHKELKPVHHGVYQIDPFNSRFAVRYSYWNGKKWSYFTEEIEDLTSERMKNAMHYADIPWRGLTEPADAAQ